MRRRVLTTGFLPEGVFRRFQTVASADAVCQFHEMGLGCAVTLAARKRVGGGVPCELPRPCFFFVAPSPAVIFKPFGVAVFWFGRGVQAFGDGEKFYSGLIEALAAKEPKLAPVAEINRVPAARVFPVF